MSMHSMAVQLRLEVDDLEKTRWTDEQLSVFLAKSARRINQLAIRHELDFAMSADDVTLKPDGSIDGIVYDKVNAVCGLFRKDNNERIEHLLPMHYLQADSVYGAAIWTFLNGSAIYREPVSEDIPAIFLHYPIVTITNIDSPWNGRLDDLIVDYAAMRAKNVDELNINTDLQIESELEKQLLANYNRLQPQISKMKGWL